MVSTALILAAAAVSAPLVAGHGYMAAPMVSFKAGDKTRPAGTINSSQFKAPAGMAFNTNPTANTDAYTAWLKSSEYTSLKDLIEKKGNIDACGITELADPQPLPAMVEWTHVTGEGFVPGHEGPCEVWCDGQMAFHDDNCAKNFPERPAKLPYDKSKCTGAKKLTMYWLALHGPEWQMYVNCAALSGASSGGGAAPAPAPATTQAPAPAPTTKTPTVRPSTPSNAPPAATPAPAAGDADDCDEEYPEPDDDCDDDLPEPDCDDDLPEPSDGAAGEADCDDDLPEPDCDDDLPEPDADCDDDLPEPDCDDDLPEPEYGGEAEVKTKDINFSTYQRSADDAPGQVYPEDF